MAQSDLQKFGILKKTYPLHNNNFVSGGLQIKKTGKTVTLYHRELLKKKSSLKIYRVPLATDLGISLTFWRRNYFF